MDEDDNDEEESDKKWWALSIKMIMTRLRSLLQRRQTLNLQIMDASLESSINFGLSTIKMVGVILVRVMMKLMMVMVMAKILGMISMVMRITLIMMIPAVLNIHYMGSKRRFRTKNICIFGQKSLMAGETHRNKSWVMLM